METIRTNESNYIHSNVYTAALNSRYKGLHILFFQLILYCNVYKKLILYTTALAEG